MNSIELFNGRLTGLILLSVLGGSDWRDWLGIESLISFTDRYGQTNPLLLLEYNFKSNSNHNLVSVNKLKSRSVMAMKKWLVWRKILRNCAVTFHSIPFAEKSYRVRWVLFHRFISLLLITLRSSAVIVFWNLFRSNFKI